MKLETAAKYMNADASGINPALLQTEFKTVAVDSREVQAGEVFFAFSQPDYKNNCFNDDFADSHKFIPSAFEKGAVACVARRDRFEEHGNALEKFKDKLLFVDDAIFALQMLAKGVYEEWSKPVVAVTGSAGKTTAKTLIAEVLSARLKVLTNIKNFNNGIGHPLTVLRLLNEPDYEVAVLEMGMSTPMNEIARLCRITPPDVAVELNVLPVHVEHLGSIENVAKAKAELVEGMKTGGTAVLNADDFRVLAMSELSKGEIITYGIESQAADVTAKNISFDHFGETVFTLRTPNGEAEVLFPLNGRHNILNALAAAATGCVFGMTAQEIAAALHTVEPPPQRGEILRFQAGFTVINDSYNSNPHALVSMVQTLVDGGGKAAKRKIVVAGEMRELGDDAAQIHRETGERIAEIGVDKLFGVEGFARNMLEGARDAGLSDVEFYADSQNAAEKFVDEVRAGDLILIKGSRGVRTEKVVEKLLEKFELETPESSES
ncbi:MAG TPA: UDP-N-acetylmuramoyl-tripeptide--D-alanyl-D-alanine ligase [Pyrinomonadaceae bacterium]|nr:UDP-N-acetylmuramoyl-tripeptide--D-alanyl-D-alanine ligase [Pyrinomonadaceae bacterium]